MTSYFRTLNLTLLSSNGTLNNLNNFLQCFENLTEKAACTGKRKENILIFLPKRFIISFHLEKAVPFYSRNSGSL